MARSAGVSHGLPGYYFGDRQGLLTAYAAEGFALLAAALNRAAGLAANAPACERLTAIGLAYLRFAREERRRFAVMFQSHELAAAAPELEAQADRAFQPLRECVGAYFADRPAEAGRAPAVTLAAWSLVHGAALLLQGPHLAGSHRAGRFGGADLEALTTQMCRDFAAANLP